LRSDRVVIVGTGHAATSAATALRRLGFGGLILLIGEEVELPYQRPPLSKEYLSGEMDRDQILLHPPGYWSDRSVIFHLGDGVVEIDPVSEVVVTRSGRRFSYTHLIWAAGGHARRLGCEGGDFAGVHTLRSRADADELRSQLSGAERIVIVGGGYVGLEAAATLSVARKEIVLLEAQDRLLARVAGGPLSDFYEREHRLHGIDIRTDSSVVAVEGGGDRMTAVRLSNGDRIIADMMIVGIGLVPNVGALLDAGAAGGNGVSVDAQCRTSLPNVYAVGDCAVHANKYADGQWVRLESVQNAHDQAAVAAKAIVGQEVVYDAVPWFWSHQYDLKLQTIGLSLGFDEVIVRGQPETRSFSLIYRKQGKVIALDCVNATRDYVQGRRLVEEGARAASVDLADAAKPLKSFATAV
jgi:3-phenylpropionate/trans-cinnamate dioxygenase ferredoxin reductase subunit